jgi:hypothetical protein
VCGQQPGYAVGARGIAGRDLPDLAHAFELPDVEGVQTHQFAGLAGGHMPRLAVLGLQGAARPLGQQPRRLQGAVLDGEAAAARAPTRPLPVLGEGVLPEELMLDVQRQIADPALHTESLVVTQQRHVEQHHLGRRGNAHSAMSRWRRDQRVAISLGSRYRSAPNRSRKNPPDS